MSIEQLLKENTAALTRMGDLLEISNAARADLLAQAGGTASAAPAASTASDSDMTVAEIKAAVKDADKATLEAMLTAENEGKARTSAVKAIQDAIDALPTGETTAEEGNEEVTEDAESKTADTTTETTTTSPASASPSDDKNAQPVPAGVTGEQAAGAFGAWFGETDDEDERAKRRAFVGQIVSTLGAKISELDEAGRRKAIFYLRRKRAGLADDFEAAFDFDGSPTQDVPEAAAAEEPAGDPNDDLL